MRRAPSAPASAPRIGLALVVSLASLGTPGLARAGGPGISAPPLITLDEPIAASPPYTPPSRPVAVDLRVTPERGLGGDSRLRITPRQPGLGPVGERPLFGPTTTLSLRPGSYSLEVFTRRRSGSVEVEVRPGMPPVQLELKKPRRESPRFDRDQRLMNGLVGAALIQVFTGAGLLVAGAVREGHASRRNDKLLMDALVDAASPAPQKPTGLALVEASYSTASYHRDLSRAMTFEVAGGAVAMAGFGAALAALPVADGGRLRAAYIEMGIGAALTAVGAASLTIFERDRKALLATTADPTERVTSNDLRPLSAASIGGSLLTGLGIGMVVFPAVALLTHAAKRRRNQRMSVTPYMAPGQAGLAWHGRF